MSRFLMIDIGAGTMDILYYETGKDLHFKAVVKSPVQHIAEMAEGLPGNIFVTGNEMGGGPISEILTKRAQHAQVVMTASSAASLNHDLDKVRSRGIRIVDDAATEKMQSDDRYSPLVLGDLQIERIKEIVNGFGVSFSFDVVGICAQDHGVPTGGLSHLDYRHNIYKSRLDTNPFPHALLYKAHEVPATLNRLTAIAQSAQMLPTNEVYVMDSGFAAILGASMDTILILDLATSHTLGAALAEGEIFGFFEYHTCDITLQRLESLIRELADGAIGHDQILMEGGHGAYVRKAFGFDSAEIILATGPKRKLLGKTHLPIIFGAPWGDNMMTGTVGLLEAIRRRKGIKPITYL
jgi:uncharacterized protein (DUF1786 family)